MRFNSIFFPLLVFLVNFQAGIIIIGSTSLFIFHIGAEHLSKVIIVNAVITPPWLIGIAYLQKRLKNKEMIFLFSEVVLLLILAIIIYISFLGYTDTAIVLTLIVGTISNLSLLITVWQIINLYFNLLEAKRSYPALAGFIEFGSVGSAIIMSTVLLGSDINDLLYSAFNTCLFTTVAILVLILKAKYRSLYFYPYESDAAVKSEGPIDVYRPLAYRNLIIVCVISTIYESIVPYQANFVMGTRFLELDSLYKAVSAYSFAQSFFVIIINVFLANYIARYIPLSKKFFVFSCVITVIVLIALVYPMWYVILMFGVSRYVMDRTTLNPSYKQLLNSFSIPVSNKLNELIEGYLTTIVTTVTGIILIAVTSMAAIEYLNVFTLVLSLLSLYLAYKFISDITNYHLQNLSSTDLDVKLRSIQALGEAKNYKVVQNLVDELNSNPPSIIRKNLIIALGEITAPTTIPLLFNEAENGTEDIQITAIEALGNFNSLRVTEFLIELLESKKLRSLNVRLVVQNSLYDMMGDNLASTLMPFLTAEHDERMIANTIEAMANIKDARIIEVLEPFLDSNNNRIRANSVLALYKFSASQDKCDVILNNLFTSEHDLDKSTFAYLVGRLKLKKYRGFLTKLISNDSAKVKLNVAYALSNLDTNSGYKLFAEILKSPDKEFVHNCFHHMVQLKSEKRLKILEAYLLNHGNKHTLKEHLISSHFNFDNELEFLSYTRLTG